MWWNLRKLVEWKFVPKWKEKMNKMKEVTKLRGIVEKVQDVVFPKEDVVITEGGVPNVSK